MKALWAVRPLRHIWAAGLLMVALSLGATHAVLATSVGRTAMGSGALPDALTALALQHQALALRQWKTHSLAVDRALDNLLTQVGAASQPAGDDPVPHVSVVCEALALPQGVRRAGVWDRTVGAPMVWLEQTRNGTCTDVLAAAADMALLGPPYPTQAQLMRLALASGAGVETAPDHGSTSAGVWRHGMDAYLRVVRAGPAGRWAVADVEVRAALAMDPPKRGGTVSQDGLWVLGGAVVGWAWGGPDQDALPDALAGVHSGRTRALDLPALALAHAAKGSLAVVYPALDDGSTAQGATKTLLADVDGLPLELWSVASAPWPLQPRLSAAQLWPSAVALALVWTVLLMLLARRLAGALLLAAEDTREAWLGLRQDDVGSPQDASRATAWLTAMSTDLRAILHSAFGRHERFWAPSPMARLLGWMKERLGPREPPPEP